MKPYFQWESQNFDLAYSQLSKIIFEVLKEAIKMDRGLCWGREMMSEHEGRKNLLLIIDHVKKEILENEESKNRWLEIKSKWLSDYLRKGTAQYVKFLLDASLFSREDIANYLQHRSVSLTRMLITMDTSGKKIRGINPDSECHFDEKLMEKINSSEHSTLYSKCLWHLFRVIWAQSGNIELAEFLPKLLLPSNISEDLNNLSKLGQDIDIPHYYVHAGEKEDWWLKWK